MLKKVFEKTKYELCIMIFLLVQIPFFLPSVQASANWPFMQYLGDYSHGFVSRALIGEFFSWFTDYTSKKFLYSFCVVICVALIFAISLLCGQVLKSARNKDYVKVPVIIMLTSPIFLTLQESWIGIIDIHLMLLTAVAFAFNENKFLRFLIPLTLVVATAIHQAYVFLYLVPICIAILYDFFKNKKFIRDGIICGVSYVAVIAVALYGVLSKTSKNLSGSRELVEYSLSKSDLPVTVESVLSLVPYEYSDDYSSVFGSIQSLMSPKNLLGLFVIFAPFFILFVYGWIKAIKHSEKKDEKFVLFLCLIHPLSTVPAYILGLNWNRWTSAIITSQCVLYLFMLYRKNEAVTLAVSRITEFLKKNYIVVVFYLIYYASFARLLGN
ncbi:MAG: hypothetical protein IKT61_05475 [Clostridia bacterium]|nr:hypothetical protein [Clostridia bacterium]